MLCSQHSIIHPLLVWERNFQVPPPLHTHILLYDLILCRQGFEMFQVTCKTPGPHVPRTSASWEALLDTRAIANFLPGLAHKHGTLPHIAIISSAIQPTFLGNLLHKYELDIPGQINRGREGVAIQYGQHFSRESPGTLSRHQQSTPNLVWKLQMSSQRE